MRGACSTLTRGAALPCRRSCCRAACGRALTTTRTCSPCGHLWTRRRCCAREAFFARPRSSFRTRARALTGACRRAATAAKTRAGGSSRTAGGWERSRRVVTFDRATGCEYLEGRADTGSTHVQVGERLVVTFSGGVGRVECRVRRAWQTANARTPPYLHLLTYMCTVALY